ncbi:hypothetical protein MRX96_007054 [Rhipicephalus microplus]
MRSYYFIAPAFGDPAIWPFYGGSARKWGPGARAVTDAAKFPGRGVRGLLIISSNIRSSTVLRRSHAARKMSTGPFENPAGHSSRAYALERRRAAGAHARRFRCHVGEALLTSAKCLRAGTFYWMRR